ncbi:MAG: hypothetical protein GWN87_26540, partial [Desulfuromonadales bacterium]|nr:hypothetical protein [Desulfuromonadales bacterium]NIS43303.1 hypothetical protein [Desulfuromonadales bacterium]
VEQTADNLQAQARLVRHHLADQLKAEHGASVDALVKKLAGETPTRITVVLPNGR